MKYLYFNPENQKFYYSEYSLEDIGYIKYNNEIKEADLYYYNFQLSYTGFEEKEFIKKIALGEYDQISGKLINFYLKDLDSDLYTKLPYCLPFFIQCEDLDESFNQCIGWTRHFVKWTTDTAICDGYLHFEKGIQINNVLEIKNIVYGIIKSEMESYISGQIIIWQQFKKYILNTKGLHV